MLADALKKIAPGTDLREAIEYIISAKTGGLIVIGDTENVLKMSNGGFELYCQFTPQRLYELTKMDGAIIMDSELNQILRSNVHLVPDSSIYTSESGMRHRTAERVAKQTKALVISVSQKRQSVTLYVDNIKYILRDTRSILAKANQALQAFEKYKTRLEQVDANLGALEYEDLVTLLDVVIVLQRSLMVERVADQINRYVYELGSEGKLIKVQSEELLANIPEHSLAIIKDYAKPKHDIEEIKLQLKRLTSEEMLDLLNIAKALGYDGDISILDTNIHPRGYRVLKKVPRLPLVVIDKIVNKFGSLQAVLLAKATDLEEVPGVAKSRAKEIHDSLRRFREASLMERYV
ncbi:MAG: DNA integrity scanning protein DisA [Actinobacteria bacterium]|nr:MAG: DNA integrity scanning protein DisA [Actinomycetota bacterium]